MYEILEVGDEWNILKCTLHYRKVQRFPITLAILEEFLVNLIFYEIKIPRMDMKVLVYSIFRKKKFKKNEISKLHEEWKISPFQV
jgi:hypothetical protein